MTWLDLLGWAGSILLVYSLMQARMLRFRALNLIACLILIVFNAILQIWPMVAMNVVLCAINLWYIRALVGSRHDAEAYQVLEVGPDDAYLCHVLREHAADIAVFQPGFTADGPLSDRSAFLVQRGDETAGVVLVRDAGAGVAQVVLDYVTPRFRDFSPGEFVYRRSGLFRDRGFTRILTPPGMVAPYYERVGFHRDGESFALDLS